MVNRYILSTRTEILTEAGFATRVDLSIERVVAEPEGLSHALSNIVDNAIKFSRKEGQVTLASSCRDGYVEVTVNDDGIGIRPDALAWVFDSFRQVDRHKREQQGAGLGLAIVRGLVQAHNGDVAVESESSVGTTVKVCLPLA